MYHISNDLRAKKSAELILQGLYKALDKKPLKEVKVNDIYINSYVSHATFYRLFDSVYDVLIYQCDLIVDEILKSMSTMEFESKKESGIYGVSLWLKHDKLIKAMVENDLPQLMYDTILSHKDGLKMVYGIDYANNPYADYFVYFLTSIIFTCFNIFYKEKGKKSLEEIMGITNMMMINIMEAWDIDK